MSLLSPSMASTLPDNVKERIDVMRAAHPDQGFKKILSQLKAEMPDAAFTGSAVRSYLRDNYAKEDASLGVNVTLVKAPPKDMIHSNNVCKPPSPNPSSPIAVVEISGKGKGIVATRDIAAGELVLAEEPLLRIRSRFLTPHTIKTAVSDLTPEKRADFYALYRSGVQTAMPELDILSTNSIQLGETGESGLFKTASRINHDCCANVNNWWSEKDNEIHWHALRPINKGEELVFSYIGALEPRKDRQEMLKNRYGFDCSCQVCKLTGSALAESDARRKQLGSIDDELNTGLANNPRRKLLQIERALPLLEQEGLTSYLYDFLAPAYQISYCLLKDIDKSKYWAKKLHPACRVLFGEKNKRTVAYKRFMETPGSPEQGSNTQAMLDMMKAMGMQTPF